jgi:hypothetical protein
MSLCLSVSLSLSLSLSLSYCLPFALPLARSSSAQADLPSSLLQSTQTPTLDDKMLAQGTWENIPAGSELDFHSAGLAGPHRTLGDNFPADGVGELRSLHLPLHTLCSSTSLPPDHNFGFTSTTRSTPQVVLTSPDDKLSLSFRTNQSTVQCYTASGFDNHGPARKSIHDPQRIGPYARFGEPLLSLTASAELFADCLTHRRRLPRVSPPSCDLPAPRIC